jgi:hypothetical protein
MDPSLLSHKFLYLQNKGQIFGFDIMYFFCNEPLVKFYVNLFLIIINSGDGHTTF